MYPANSADLEIHTRTTKILTTKHNLLKTTDNLVS